MKYDFPHYNLDEFCTFEQGVQIPSSETIKQIETGYIRYLYIRDFYTDQFKVFVKDFYPNKILKETDVIMVNTGATAGDVYRGKTGVLCNNAFVIRVKTRAFNKLDNDYLWYYLNSEYKKRFLNKLFNSAGQPHVGHKNVALFKIPLPPLPQQHKIAEILSTWDEAITKTEALIAALEQRKKGLMQRLLTGQVRFPGFTDPWREVRLGEVAKINKDSVSENTNPKKFFSYIDLSAVKRGVINYDNNFVEFRNLPSRARRIFHKNDVLMSTVRPNLLGYAFCDQEPKDILCSTGFAVISTKNKFDAQFIYHNLYGDNIQRQIFALVVGSNYPAVNNNEVKKLKISWPNDIKEREKIVTILRINDIELDQNKYKLKLFEKQKKGLMQRLLTGEVRVQV